MPAAGSDFSQLAARGQQAAFYGRPADGLEPLNRAIGLCRETGDGDGAHWAAWLLGVCLCATGRYGSAMGRLQPLLGDLSTPGRVRSASLAAVTIASIYRQVNRYEEARGFDQWAVRTGHADPAVPTDAGIGLAADAVGAGDVALASRLLDEAMARHAGHWDWRTAVRADWVRAEISLAARDPEQAVRSATSALDRAEASGAPRHVAKSLLFSGAARMTLATGGDKSAERDAVSDLRRAAALARSLGTLPLLWPSLMLLSQSSAATEESRRRDRAEAAGAVRAIVSDLPAVIATTWVTRPEIAGLLAAG